MLDETGEQVKHGEMGEIAVRSQEIASGYWHKSSLIQANFIRDPEDNQKGVYLTGDLGRLRPDGMLQFLGRKDSMVKDPWLPGRIG